MKKVLQTVIENNGGNFADCSPNRASASQFIQCFSRGLLLALAARIQSLINVS